MSSAPAVIRFDEATGKQIHLQVDFSFGKETRTPNIYKLPWRQWHRGVGKTMGETDADKAAAVAVLEGLHQNFPVDQEPIEMWVRDGVAYVIATGTVKPNEIMLPPSVLKQGKVLEKSEHLTQQRLSSRCADQQVKTMRKAKERTS